VAEEIAFPRGRATIVGILNVTPDSFSDGGRVWSSEGRVDLERAVAAGLSLVRDGAHVIDVGGESTRPGAPAVSEDEEIDRTVPVVEALAKATAAPISIDTRKSSVARAALEAGARIVNDVSGLRHDPHLAKVAARASATLVLGHLRGEPATMQARVVFEDCLREVSDELAESVEIARRAGVLRERLVVDPGIGFGKRLRHNLALLANLGVLRERLDLPLLVGPSRKAFLGELTGEPVAERDRATEAVCAIAVFAGADGVRVHDVAGARRALAIGLSLREARRGGAV
jgi:dihydropteroate synthase